jgi:hypothetical protein
MPYSNLFHYYAFCFSASHPFSSEIEKEIRKALAKYQVTHCPINSTYTCTNDKDSALRTYSDLVHGKSRDDKSCLDK